MNFLNTGKVLIGKDYHPITYPPVTSRDMLCLQTALLSHARTIRSSASGSTATNVKASLLSRIFGFLTRRHSTHIGHTGAAVIATR